MSLEYCAKFRALYGNFSDTRIHYQFVHRFCREFVAQDLDKSGFTFDGLIASQTIKFVGLADSYYEASICLLLWQLGRFPADVCRCEGGQPSAKQREMVSRHDQNRLPSAAHGQKRTSGIPELRVSSEDMQSIGPRDSVVYREAMHEFVRRVRAVEAYLGEPFMHCRLTS